MSILNYPTAGALGENDFFYVVQNGLDKKATFKQLPIPVKLVTTEIPAKDDLNNYNKEGWYYCPLTDNAMTLLNCPINSAFSLVVNRITQSGYTQKLVGLGPENPPIWIRNVYNGYWGKWNKISFIDTSSKMSSSYTDSISLSNNILPPPPANSMPTNSISDSYNEEFAKNTKTPDNDCHLVNLDRLTKAVEHLCKKFPEDTQLQQILTSEVNLS